MSLSKVDFGLRLALDRGLVDWNQVNAEQRRGAIASVLLRHDNFPDWFVCLYQAFPRQIYDELREILALEACRPNAFPLLASQLTRYPPLGNQFARLAADYLTQNGWPEAERFLEQLLPAALRYQKINWSSRLRCEIEASLDRLDERQRPNQRILTLLAAWWHHDWRNTWDFSRNRLFLDISEPSAQAWFEGFFRAAAGKSYGRYWENVQFEALAILIPLAYQTFPGFKPSRRNERITRATELHDMRRALVSRLAAAPSEQVLVWFRDWIGQPQFEVDQDWFLNIVTELQIRLAAEFWQPTPPEKVMEAVFRNGRIIRNAVDLFALTKDLINDRLRRLMQEEYSPLPLLYQGKKENRVPLDEKAVQTLFYNQLRLLLEGYRIIGAREPEVWDQKKPDFRLSVILDSGEKIHIPIEVKKDDNDELKDAAEDQLLKKYMRAESSPYGVLLVAWFNTAPKRLAGKDIDSLLTLQTGLQEKIDQYLQNKVSKKQVAVFVVDCCIEKQ